MSIPTPYTVSRAPFLPGATDAHGNAVDAWGASVSVAVHGWAPPSADTAPAASGRDPVVRDVDLYVPAGTACGPRDRWTLDGTVYEQVGRAEDYTRGPWSWAAGLRINLKRDEG